MHVHHRLAESLPSILQDESVDLLLTDPPYYGIVEEAWDNQWSTPQEFAVWLARTLLSFNKKLHPNASMLVFQSIGMHGIHPVFDMVRMLETNGWHFRNWITWKKRRAYGKSHDYLYVREEILWFSKNPERTSVTFNIPLLDEKRGYAGFNKSYSAKSEYKRVGNVMTDFDPVIEDCPELMRPERACQKPSKLMERLLATHSNPGDLVVDPFSGYGSTGIAAVKMGRRFIGCESIQEDALAANSRVEEAAKLL